MYQLGAFGGAALPNKVENSRKIYPFRLLVRNSGGIGGMTDMDGVSYTVGNSMGRGRILECSSFVGVCVVCGVCV